VRYEIHVGNRGDAKPDVTYEFRFSTQVRNPRTFLYNTGPITTNTNADYRSRFPYLGPPAGGYQTTPGVPAA
jgi:hypothetical protein